MKGSRTYRAKSVKKVDWREMLRARGELAVHVGTDIGKRAILAGLRWQDGRFERPWLVKNTEEIREFVALLQNLGRGRELTVAMEPTGTYGDALRQALFDAGIRLERVSPKVAHDYAEVFDGVPSQFDGKDAAIVAELSALGKSQEWKYAELPAMDQEMAYWVDWMDAQRRQGAMWLGRLEALLARHWPEATRWLKLGSSTLLHALQQYGGPKELARDPRAAARVAGWGRCFLSAEKIHGLLASARETVGVRQGEIDVRRMRQYAGQALASRREVAEAKRRLAVLARGNPVIQAQTPVVGVATACVLWVYLGDPRDYSCAAAYRKAMGLNLREYSSGDYRGPLRISKRGSASVRRWLYFAALRWSRQGAAKRWYLRKRARDAEKAKRAVIGLMRKLAKGLHRVGTTGEPFQPGLLFAGRRSLGRPGARRSTARRTR
jgi:transposase